MLLNNPGWRLLKQLNMKCSIELPTQPSRRRPHKESDSFVSWRRPTEAVVGATLPRPPIPQLFWALGAHGSQMWSCLYCKVRAPTVPKRWPGARPTDNGTTAAPCLKGGQNLWGNLCPRAPLQTLCWDPWGTRLKLSLQVKQYPRLAFLPPALACFPHSFSSESPQYITFPKILTPISASRKPDQIQKNIS